MAKKKQEVQDPQAIMNAKLDAMRAAIFKKFGTEALTSLTGIQTMPHFPFQIPTGSVNLDLSIGIVRKQKNGVWQTGLPPGRVHETPTKGGLRYDLCRKHMGFNGKLGLGSSK